MESACVEAAGRGLMSLLDVEAKVVSRAEAADDFAKVFADKAAECVKVGDAEGAVLFANAGVKWFAEGTKGWRAVKEMTGERFRRAEIEKTKRLLDRVRNGQKGSN
jgi:hypothetical protein